MTIHLRTKLELQEAEERDSAPRCKVQEDKKELTEKPGKTNQFIDQGSGLKEVAADPHIGIGGKDAVGKETQ